MTWRGNKPGLTPPLPLREARRSAKLMSTMVLEDRRSCLRYPGADADARRFANPLTEESHGLFPAFRLARRAA